MAAKTRDVVLELLEKHFPRSLTVNQITGKTGISNSAVRRALEKLEADRLVGHDLTLNHTGLCTKEYHA